MTPDQCQELAYRGHFSGSSLASAAPSGGDNPWWSLRVIFSAVYRASQDLVFVSVIG